MFQSTPTWAQFWPSAYLLFSVGLWFKYVTTLIWRKQQLCVLHTATLVSPSPSLVTREYLVAPFNQPAVWRGLKQRIQQEHLKKPHTKQVAGSMGSSGKLNCLVLDIQKKINKIIRQSFAINNNLDVYCAWAHTLERRLRCPPPSPGRMAPQLSALA